MKIVTMIALITIPVTAFAQNPLEWGGPPDRSYRRERIEMMRNLKMVEELDLTEEQSIKLLNRQRLAEDDIFKIGESRRELYKRMEDNLKAGDLNKKDLDEYIKRIADLAMAAIDRQQKLYSDVDDILSVEQKAKYVLFRQMFTSRMYEMMDQMRRRGPGDRGQQRNEERI